MPEETMTCRSILLSEHHQDAVSIFVESYALPPWSEDWSLDLATLRISDMAETPGCISAGVFEDGALIGFAVGTPDTSPRGRSLYLREVVLAPAQQGRGLGTILLAEMERLAWEAGYSGVWLVTARAGSTERFYAKAGFEETGTLMIFGKDLLGYEP